MISNHFHNFIRNLFVKNCNFSEIMLILNNNNVSTFLTAAAMVLRALITHCFQTGNNDRIEMNFQHQKSKTFSY